MIISARSIFKTFIRLSACTLLYATIFQCILALKKSAVMHKQRSLCIAGLLFMTLIEFSNCAKNVLHKNHPRCRRRCGGKYGEEEAENKVTCTLLSCLYIFLQSIFPVLLFYIIFYFYARVISSAAIFPEEKDAERECINRTAAREFKGKYYIIHAGIRFSFKGSANRIVTQGSTLK